MAVGLGAGKHSVIPMLSEIKGVSQKRLDAAMRKKNNCLALLKLADEQQASLGR